MRKMIVMLVAMITMGIALGSDPGGYPGLLVAKFNAAYDTTSDIRSSAFGRVYEPREMYADSLPTYTTYGWTGYMWMEGGVTYNFKGCYDDFTTVKINGSWVYTRGSDCAERQGSYTPTQSDWFPVEFRVGNNGGGGGCQNASCYGILWNTSQDSTWRRICAYVDGIIFKTGDTTLKSAYASSLPIVISSSIRLNDPTILDTRFIVLSDNATVNVRALAFEDGERSFWKVVRPETFIDGTAENVGDNIAANTEHTLSWKVSADWDTDLAKVKFEVLVSEQGQLPLDLVKVPGVNGWPDIEFSTNTQTDANVLNAMFWYYAVGEKDLAIDDGYLSTTNGITLVRRNAIGDKFNCIQYIAEKMNMEIFGGTAFHYAVAARRTAFSTAWDSMCRTGMLNVAGSVYVGEKAYCVIDVSGGTAASTYPVSYIDSFPIAGWGDEYKTTKILLRRIEPGTVLLGGIKPVTLTKPFYIGVFEITQKQYQLVVGSNPSQHKGDMRPVENVSWNAIRGNSSTYNWPNVTTVDPATFIGKIQSKTHRSFDLPTESQWEYACRAGTTSAYNNGGTSDNDLKLLGRYPGNKNDGRGEYSLYHTTVGSYTPNAWGLYDMHGNVWDWCLDWYSSINSDPVTDWGGVSSGSSRVHRGTSWNDSSSRAGSSSRYDNNPGNVYSTASFRIAWTLSNE